ncbi:MAG: undecaprenyl diphosphate synthase family protein, partial [Lachnospiraceae bacterium]|nr:undecaprenyl diphosphate synthase family protein [Candidatus Equihabitans merdae]
TYSEIYFTDTLWPDFSKEEMMKAIDYYNDCQINKGK